MHTDLANLYQVPTKALNQAFRRNREKFPEDLLFQLTWEEAAGLPSLRSQFVTLKRGQHLKYRPFAFTEHGALMAATVLNSPRAVAHSSSPNPISAFLFFVPSFVVGGHGLCLGAVLGAHLVEHVIAALAAPPHTVV